TAFAPLATLAGVTVAASLAFGASKLMARSKLLSRAMTEALEHYASLAAARLRGWRLVKGFATEDQEALKLDEIGKRIGRLNRDHVFQAGLLQIAIGPVALGLLLVGVHFGYYYLDMSIAMIVIFVALMVRLIPIVEQLSRLRHSFTIAEAALERIETLVTEANSARESNTGMMTFAGATNSVSIKDVTFTYPGTLRPAITDCKIELPAGQTIALVGPSGAGKSTLIDLLVRLLMPDSGNITIDGIDLQSYSLSSLRRGIVTAGQSVVFFDDTILANLQYAKPNASKDDLRLALDRGGASDFIKLLPNGMDTVIGEDGLLLSGGQRQRLALARAYLAGAKIIVLDEPTSAMDFEAEKAFREQLAVVAKDPDTTVIIIAHRASTIRDVDQIFVLENGTVTESGSPSELLARNSYYRRMIDADLKIKSPSHDLQPKLAVEEQIQR
ncbi:MAG: ABC transporter ATP-binding protein, partial [Pseudomonadota bacterium]